jgi:hypothetical protein
MTPHLVYSGSSKCMNYVQKLQAAVWHGESRIPLLFNMESHYSIVCSGKSLLSAKSNFFKFWRTPPAFKGIIEAKIDYACRALLIRESWKSSKIWVIWVALCFILTACCHWPRGVNIFTFRLRITQRKFGRNSKSLLGMSLVPKSFNEQNGSKKISLYCPFKQPTIKA